LNPKIKLDTLVYFGLSINQAKIFLALKPKKFLTANEIRKTSNTPRQDVYRNLNKLYELGLVEKALGRPVRFKSVLIENGISFLVERKKQEMENMQFQANQVIENYKSNNNNHNFQEFDPHFVIIQKKEASIAKRLEEIDSAQRSLDFISSWKRFPKTIEIFSQKAIKALVRNVKIRVILEKPKDLKQIPKLVTKLEEFPNYNLRYTLKKPTAIIGIFDKKRAIIKTSAKVDLAETPSLWTSNQCLVSVMIEYFESYWKGLIKNPRSSEENSILA